MYTPRNPMDCDNGIQTKYQKDKSPALSQEQDFKSTTTLHRNEICCKEEEEEKKYNPFEHRNILHPTTSLGSFFHLLKSSLGSGLLAMPAAFKHAGLIPGSIGTILVAIIATHCVHILVRTSRELCQRKRIPLLSYTDTCENAFRYGPEKLKWIAKHVRYFVDCSMAGVCLGGTSVYVIFIASSLKDISDHYYPDQKFPVELHCIFLLLPLILITQVRYLKFLVPFSMFANLCLLVTFVITCYYSFTDIPTIDEGKFVADPMEWPFFLSTAIFAMEGINVVMPVENEMKEPQHFLGGCGVLNLTMFLVATLYGFVGIVGYLKYGDSVLGSITLNLPQDQTLALIAKVLVALAVFFTYCLQMYAPMEIIWTKLGKKVSSKYKGFAQIALRTSSVVLTVILAIAVPDLELLINVVGAIFFSTLGLFIPIVIETVYNWERDLGCCYFIVWKNLALLLFYLLVLFSGCYASISEIFKRFSMIYK